MANPIAVPGTNVPSGAGVSPGGAQGVAGPIAVSANAGNIATLGTDNLILVPQSQLWSMRLRSFNAVGNPNFEVDQINVGNTVTNPATATKNIDRWVLDKQGTMAVNVIQAAVSLPDVCVPGTNFRISRSFYRLALTTAQATLGTSDQLCLRQQVEAPNWRELSNDVHSVSLLVRSSVAGLNFGVALRDPPTATTSLTKLCNIPSANTWTLITLPNLPVWPSGNFQGAPGLLGYQIQVTLAAGSSLTSAANDTWQSTNVVGALGQSNFANTPVNSTFDIAFVQHEPGPLCTTLQDKPFAQNYDECLRYFCKSYDYAVKTATASVYGYSIGTAIGAVAYYRSEVTFPKKMAKAPTISVWGMDGSANNVYDDTSSTNRAVTVITGPAEKGFAGVGISAALAGSALCRYHWTADTGW